jgi:ribonucleases P/MRP protein subunit RPP40
LKDSLNNTSDLFLYADDAKLFTHIKEVNDIDLLQKDLSDIQQWMDKWLLKLNIKKCNVVSYGHHLISKNNYYLHSETAMVSLEHLDFIKDLGVLFDSKLKFDCHINEKVNKAYSILGLIYRNFKYISSDTFVLLYKSLVRSHLEYAVSVWSPSRLQDIEKLEKVQKRATRMIKQLKNYSYEARLKWLNLPTLKYRRLRGDMIQVYNIVSGKYKTNPTVNFNLCHVSNTRGNMYNMHLSHMHYNLRKYFFCNRVVQVWNSLPNTVVSAESTNIFKNRLDQFWCNQDIRFNWNADITGTGSRSVINANIV